MSSLIRLFYQRGRARSSCPHLFIVVCGCGHSMGQCMLHLSVVSAGPAAQLAAPALVKARTRAAAGARARDHEKIRTREATENLQNQLILPGRRRPGRGAGARRGGRARALPPA